jgi:hypothetical protein
MPCHVCCSFPPQSTTFSVYTHPHPYILYWYILCIPFTIILHIYTQRWRKHPRGYRHTTPRPIDSLSFSVSPAVHSLSTLAFPNLSCNCLKRSKCSCQWPLWLSFYLVQATYVFLKAFLFPIGVLSKLPLVLLLWDVSSVSSWFFCYRCYLISPLEGYMVVPFGTQHDLSRFLLPMVPAECCN